MAARFALGFFLLGGIGIACAPPADFRPPNALVENDRTFEVGAAAVNVSARPYVDEPSQNIGQLWFSGRPNRWLNLSVVGAFDNDGGAGGLGALARYVTTDRFVAGVGAEAGFAWAGASLSGAGRLFDRTWVYAAPRVYNWGDSATVGIPAGVSARIVDGFVLRAEGQVSWADLKYYNRRTHLGAALVYTW